MTRTVKYAFTFEVEINDHEARQAFNDRNQLHGPAGDALPDGRELAVRASAHVIAGAFTELKQQTGLQLRSFMVND